MTKKETLREAISDLYKEWNNVMRILNNSNEKGGTPFTAEERFEILSLYSDIQKALVILEMNVIL